MAPSALSDERVQDSSDEESTNSEQPRSLKDLAKSPLRSQTDGNNDSDEDTPSTGSDASSNSSASSRSKRKMPERAVTSPEPASKRAKPSHSSVNRIQSTTYVPPPGYTPSTITEQNFSTKTSGVFDDLSEKQIWHITAPATMPISKLESLDLTAALKGTPVVEHKGTSYILDRADNNGTTLLLPKGASGEYTASRSGISQSFCIQEATVPMQYSRVKDGEQDSDDGASEQIRFFATKTGQSKAPRQQPENLRTRYTPFGAQQAEEPTTMDANSDLVMEDVESVQGGGMTGNELPGTPEPKKPRKKSRIQEINPGESPVKISSSKKKKRDKSNQM